MFSTCDERRGPQIAPPGRARALITVFVVFVVLVAATVVPQRASAVLAQELPTAEPLLTMMLETLPAAPIRVQLFRMTLAPGATVPLHTRPGPELNRIEAGTFGAVVQGTPLVERASDEGAEPEASPEAGTEFSLTPGDQIVFPPQSSRTMRNLGETPAALVGVLFLPVGHQHPPAISWAGTEPTVEELRGINSQLLGDGRMDEIAEGSREVVVERLALAPGVAVPAHEGPVMLSVELGDLAFTLISGEVQIATAERPGEPQLFFKEGVRITLGVRDAAFFVGGTGDIERTPEAGVAVLLRLSMVVSDEPRPESTATDDDGDDQATAPADEPEATAPADDAAPIEPGAIVIVTEDGVRLRDEPSAGGDIVTVLERGRQLRVTGEAVEVDGVTWWPVQDRENLQFSGYVSAEFLEVAPDE